MEKKVGEDDDVDGTMQIKVHVMLSTSYSTWNDKRDIHMLFVEGQLKMFIFDKTTDYELFLDKAK